MWDLTSREYAPASEAGLTLDWLHFSCPPEILIPFGQDQLTEVGHSINSGVSRHSVVLSFQCAVALIPLVNTLEINGEFLSCSVDAGFILALLLYHRDPDLYSVGVSMKSGHLRDLVNDSE